MSCKSYRDALIEAAATGAEMRPELHAHLAVCPGCIAAFEQERALFSAMDSSLQRTANAEVPASLLPRVQARLDEMPAGKSMWNVRWVTLATAAVIVAGVFAVRSAWHKDVLESLMETGKAISAPRATAPLATQKQNAATHVAANSGSHARTHSASPLPGKTTGRTDSAPEVLVPKDQELLLAGYAEEWRRRKGTVVLAQTFDTTVFSPLQVAPIQIDGLDVKPLAEGDSQ